MDWSRAVLLSVICPGLQHVSRFSHKRHVIRKKGHKIYFYFIYNFSETFLILEELRYIWIKMYIGLHVKYPFFLLYLTILEFFRHIFEKYSNVKFHESPFSGSRVIPCGQINRRTDRRTDGQMDRRTDRHDEANNRFSQFFERAKQRDRTCDCICTVHVVRSLNF